MRPMRLLAAGSLMLALSAPALAGFEEGTIGPSLTPNEMLSPRTASHGYNVGLVAGSKVLGSKVSSLEGATVGVVKYLLIDSATGQVTHAMLVPPGTTAATDEALLPVRWSALTMPEIGKMAFHDQGSAAIQNMTRYRENDLYRLVMPPERAQVPQRERVAQRERAPFLLFGQGRLAVVAAPNAPGSGPFNVPIADPKTQRISEVQDIMIDSDLARIAYLVVSETEFGKSYQPGQLIPVPLEAVSWVPGRQVFVVGNISRMTEAFTLMPDLAQREAAPPRSVPRATLASLYEHYGLDPYWQERR